MGHVLSKVFLVALICLALPVAAAEYKRAPGAYKVSVLNGEWVDAARDDRTVPYKIYFTPDLAAPQPVVLFSHGLGGSRDGAAYLGEHLASYGYVTVYAQHPGTDRSIWENGLNLSSARRSAGNLRHAVARFEDIPFAVDSLEEMNRSGSLEGRLDLSRIGMSGHSYGAISTLMAAGQKVGWGGARFADPRLTAAIAYSPSPPGGGLRRPRRDNLDAVYAEIAIPIFHMTGTEDGSPLRDMDPAERRIPFDSISTVDQYLLILNSGDHMVFSGQRLRGPAKATDARHHDLIRMATIAFWDAELRGDPAARAWLDGGGFAAELGSDGSFDVKQATR